MTTEEKKTTEAPFEFYSILPETGVDGIPTLRVVRMTKEQDDQILVMVEDFGYYQPAVGARQWSHYYRVIVLRTYFIRQGEPNQVKKYDWLDRWDYASQRGADNRFNSELKSKHMTEVPFLSPFRNSRGSAPLDSDTVTRLTGAVSRAVHDCNIRNTSTAHDEGVESAAWDIADAIECETEEDMRLFNRDQFLVDCGF